MKYLVPVEPAPSLGEQSPILRLAFKVSGNPAPSMLQVQAAGGLFMMHWAVSTHLSSLPMSLYAFIFSLQFFVFFLSMPSISPSPPLPVGW